VIDEGLTRRRRVLTSPAVATALLVLGTGMVLGFNLVAVKFAVRDSDPVTIQAVATVIGVIAMVVVPTLIGRGSLPDKRESRAALIVGLAMSVASSLFISFGVQRIDAGLSALIMSTTPIMTLLLGRVLLRERHSWHGPAGVACGLVGVATVSAGAGMSGDSSLSGVVLVVLGALGWSVGLIAMRVFGVGMSANKLTAWQMAFGAPILVVVAVVAFGFEIDVTASFVGAVIYMGLMAKGLGTVMQLHTIRISGAVQASMTAFLMPLFGTLGGVVMLGESVAGYEVAGAVGILAGVALVLRARGKVAPVPTVPPA
jgi:drug/metabolite transporter (DMT)-like permease